MQAHWRTATREEPIAELERRERENQRLRREREQAERDRDRYRHERDRMRKRIERLEDKLDAAQRALHRQAAPFSRQVQRILQHALRVRDRYQQRACPRGAWRCPRPMAGLLLFVAVVGFALQHRAVPEARSIGGVIRALAS